MAVTDLRISDNSDHTIELNTDLEPAYDIRQQPPSKMSDPASATEINERTKDDFPQKEPSHSRVLKNNLRPNLNPNYSKIY